MAYQRPDVARPYKGRDLFRINVADSIPDVRAVDLGKQRIHLGGFKACPTQVTTRGLRISEKACEGEAELYADNGGGIPGAPAAVDAKSGKKLRNAARLKGGSAGTAVRSENAGVGRIQGKKKGTGCML